MSATPNTDHLDHRHNRESWLAAATDLLRPTFEAEGYPIPEKVRVSCGFPSSGATRSKNRVIGQCHYATTDGIAQLFITPMIVDTTGEYGVLATLAHELLHAILGPEAGHKAPFARAAAAIGLAGKPTSTFVEQDSDLRFTFDRIATELGPYPHAAVSVQRKPQKTRMLKVSCPDYGYILRTVLSHIVEKGLPTCPCGSLMVEQGQEPEGEKLLPRDVRRVYVTGDGRFEVAMSRTFRARNAATITWTVLDFEAIEREVEREGAVLVEYVPRSTVLYTKQDVLDFIAAVRSGDHEYAPLTDDEAADHETDDDWYRDSSERGRLRVQQDDSAVPRPPQPVHGRGDAGLCRSGDGCGRPAVMGRHGKRWCELHGRELAGLHMELGRYERKAVA